MVRFLLHSEDASYDPVTKTYTFALDQRIHRPVALRVQKAHYAGPAGVTNPLVVYLESDALTKIIRQKHTLQVTNTGHEHGTSVIATLGETHTAGRYSMERDARTLKCDPDKHVKNIDIKFSSNGTLLTKSASEGSSSSGGGSGDDSSIEAIDTDLLWWWDFDPSRVLDSSFAPVSTNGGQVNYYYNRTPAPQNLLLVTGYGSGLQLANVGADGAKGVTRSGSWESILDSSQPNPSVSQEFAFHSLITMPAQMATISYLIDMPGLKVYTQNGAISFRNYADSGSSTNMSYVPLRTYILSIQRRTGTVDHNGDGVIDAYELSWQLTDLVTNSTQTDLTVSSWPFTTGGASSFRIGKASYHLDHVQGGIVAYNGTSSVHWDSSTAWLKAQYEGTASSASGEAATTADSEWFVELDILQQ